MLLKGYFLFILAVFSLSASYYVGGGNIHSGVFPELYILKHLSLAILATVYFLRNALFYRRVHIYLIFIFSPYLFYLFIDNGIVFFQFSVFILSSIFLSKMYENYFLPFWMILLYALIIASVPIIDFIYNSDSFLLNSFYGRERLLLGYSHPKEGSSVFLVLFLIILFSKKVTGNFFNIFFHLCAITLLFYMQSRNALLLYVNFIFFNALIEKFGLKISLISIVLIYLVIPILSIGYFFHELDVLSSFRLTRWVNMVDISVFGRIFDIKESGWMLFQSKHHVDNYYFEVLTEIGYFPLFLLIISLLYVCNYIKYVKVNGYSILGLFISFLIYCFFDASMFSTGNFLNLFIWSVTIYAITNKHNLLSQSLK